MISSILALSVLISTSPDCNVFKKAYDNPFSDTKLYSQYRIAWHVERGALANIEYKLSQKFHVPSVIGHSIPAVIITSLHIRGQIKRLYKLNLSDWIADDLIVTIGTMNKKYWLLYPIPACFASP